MLHPTPPDKWDRARKRYPVPRQGRKLVRARAPLLVRRRVTTSLHRPKARVLFALAQHDSAAVQAEHPRRVSSTSPFAPPLSGTSRWCETKFHRNLRDTLAPSSKVLLPSSTSRAYVGRAPSEVIITIETIPIQYKKWLFCSGLAYLRKRGV